MKYVTTERKGVKLIIRFSKKPRQYIREGLSSLGYRRYSDLLWIGGDRYQDAENICAAHERYWTHKSKMYGETICWSCANACGGCEWSERFRPVPGWTAVETVIKINATVNGSSQKTETQSYHVISCPKYQKG